MDVLMPQMGETVAEGTLTVWHKKVGETVKPNDILFEIGTDKVEMEVPALTDGVLTEILVQAGETVVAVINGEATLKRYYIGSNGIELHPRNNDYAIINVSKDDDLVIQGKVLGVFREYN